MRHPSELSKICKPLPLALSALVIGLLPSVASAQEGTLDSGDTAWMMVSTAFVIMMTAPGLALFYGGLVRRANVLSVLMQCLTCMGVLTLVWIVIGYTLAFGPDIGGVIGGLDHMGLAGIGLTPGEGETIPPLLFAVFQGTFAVITPALIIGAFAERMKFSAFLIFSVLWSICIYAPLCHWVWGGGWLGAAGDLDFAGGTVVHISSGTAALVAALLIGKRLGYGSEPMPPHNLPFTVAGAALLWVGWFGFNAGSALGANEDAVLAFATTNTAAAAATVSWILIEWWTLGKPTALGAASGLVAGLVAITPACGFVSPMAALIIGLVAGVLCFYGIRLKERLGADDALDVVGIHGVGGTWGALATGIFALEGFLVEGGRMSQFIVQLEGVGITILFAGVGSWILLKITGALTGGLRVDEEAEQLGLDLGEHSVRGYILGSSGD